MFLLVQSVPVAYKICCPSSDAISEGITPGEFKLYANPGVTPNPSCDPHTKLSLKAGAAHLEEAVGGSCEIVAVPNPRDYALHLDHTDCGSNIFVGTTVKDGSEWSITITDHRTRMCRDIPPAEIVVEETRGTATITKFSSDVPSEPVVGEVATVSGQLVHVVGIGGESTGYAVMTEAGSYELVLDPAERNLFVDGQKARVTGKVTLLSGVETRDRRALAVSDMLVCPTANSSINCMPRPNVRLSNLCAADNRAWISENCGGVSYLD